MKDNIFTRFINFIKKLFGKDEPKQLSAQIETIEKKETKPSFFEEIKIPVENPKNSKLLKLQKQFENNEIDLCVISNEEIHELNSLYKTQVSDLKSKLSDKKTELSLIQKRIANYSTNA